MKILRLKIENLASIASADIDFESDVLREEPIFLICGDTGAGKTTLLDAITIALYDEVSRYASAQKDRFLMDAANGDMAVSDVLNIVRRGAASALAEVTFLADDGKIYKALWAVARARGKADGRFQSKRRELHCITDSKILASHAKECDLLIPKILGLTYAQFTKTVMLPQNQFAEFLRAPKKEKSEILEMLVGNEIYSTISQRIHEHTLQAKRSKEDADTRLGTVVLLTDEERQAEAQTVAELQQQREAQENALAQIDARLKWVADEAVLHHEMDDANYRWCCTEEHWQSAEVRAKDETLLLLDRTAEILPKVEQLQRLQKEMQEQNSQCEVVRQRWQQVCARHKGLKDLVQQIGVQMAALTAQLQQQAAYRPWAEHLQTIESAMQVAANAMSQQRRWERELSEKQQTRPAVQQKREALRLEIQKIEPLKQQALEQKEHLKQGCDPIYKEQLLTQQEQQRIRRQLLADALNLLTLIETAQKSEREAHRNLEVLLKENADLPQQLLQATTLADVRAEQYEADNALCTAQAETMQSWAKSCRARLKPGMPCPVCGSTEHTIQPDEVLTRWIAQAQAKRDASQKLWSQAQGNVSILRARSESLKGLIAEAQARWQEVAKAGSNYRISFGNLLLTEAAEGDLVNIDSVRDRLTAQQEETGRLIQTQTESLRQVAEREKALQQADEHYLNLLNQEDRLKEQAHAIDARLQLTDQEIESMRQQVRQCSDTRTQALQSLQSYFADGAWIESWTADPERLLQFVRRQASVWTDLTQRLEAQKLRQSQQAEYLRLSDITMEALSAAEPTWLAADDVVAEPMTDGAALPAECAALHNLAEMTRGRVETLRAEMQKTDAALTAAIDAYNAKEDVQAVDRLMLEDLLNRKTQVQGYRAELTELRRVRAEAQGHYRQAEAKWKAHTASPERPADGVTLDALTVMRMQAVEQRQLQTEAYYAHLNRLKTDDDNRQTRAALIETRDALNVEYRQWYSLDELFGSTDGEKFRNIAQSWTLRILLEQANVILKQLCPRYELNCRPGSLVIMVRDLDDGGSERVVNGVSGGETFILSMALSLSLSQLNDNGLRIDSLFIDEGFGSLSETYLDNALSVLESLHADSGRKIGIISHVEKLKERIPVHVRLERIDPYTSRVVVGQ